MIRCFECGSKNCVKSGFMQGMQRYKCKDCNKNFIDKPRRGYGQMAAAAAIWMHANGVSLRCLAKMFNVTPAAITKWIKQFKPPSEN